MADDAVFPVLLRRNSATILLVSVNRNVVFRVKTFKRDTCSAAGSLRESGDENFFKLLINKGRLS